MDYPENQYILKGDGIGSIKISDDVVKVIAGLAAVEVEGVTAYERRHSRWYCGKARSQEPSKGVKADVGEKEALIDLCTVDTARIQDVAGKIQSNVKTAVENMTGLRVLQVNVNVQGVSFGPDNKEEDGRVK